MTVILKQDRSKSAGARIFYFSDGANIITDSFTNKQTDVHVKLLTDLGITVLNRTEYHFAGSVKDC